MDGPRLVPAGGQLVTDGRESHDVLDVDASGPGAKPTLALHLAKADAGHPPDPLPRLAVLATASPRRIHSLSSPALMGGSQRRTGAADQSGEQANAERSQRIGVATLAERHATVS
jgi:hypothetical protein